jgi:hypothetical protein
MGGVTVVAPKEAAPARATRLTGRPLTLVTGLCAAAPVIASLVRALADGWVPAGDQGIIATRAYDVFSSHAPLLGQYSQASTVTGHPLYSPGPLLYWLLAAPARVGGFAALTLTMAAVNALSIVGAVALARRRGGLPLMFAAAAALAVMCRSLSAEALHDVFNPAAALLPFTLLIFLSWSLACGDHRLLPLTVVVASFVAQCHLAYVIPVAGLLAVAAVGLVATRPHPRRWVIAAALAAAICWSAPLVDQVEHSGGNLGSIASAATSRRATEGTTPAARAGGAAIGVPPRWLRTPQTRARDLGGVSGGDYGDTRLNDIWTAPSALATASAVLVLVALLIAAAVGLRRKHGPIAAAAAIGLVQCLALGAVVATTPASAANTIGYTTWWGSPAGMWAWLVVAWSAVSLIRVRPRSAGVALSATGVAAVAAAGAGVAAVAAAGALAAATAKPDAHVPVYRPTRSLVAAVDSEIPAGTAVWLVQRGFVVVPIEPAVRFALRRHGVRALGNLATLRSGPWYELDHRRYGEVLAIWSNGNAPPVKPLRLVARVGLVDRKGRHVVTAALSPPPPRR